MVAVDEEDHEDEANRHGDIEQGDAERRCFRGEGSMMSIIITVIVQTGAHTWQVDLGSEISRTLGQFRSGFYAIAAIPISEFNGSRFD